MRETHSKITPWNTLRAAIRLVAIALGTLIAVAFLLPGPLVGRLAPQLRARWNGFVFRCWSRFGLVVFGARLTVEGDPPEAPFLLVANHLGYVDIFVLASRLDAVFIAKAEIADWTVMGLACKLVRTIFVDRNLKRDIPRVLLEIEDRLRYRQGVVLFPEGTSSGGAEVRRFRPALLEVAARADHPVHHASLAYRTPPDEPPAHLAVCWWGDRPFLPHFLRLLMLPGFEASLVFGSEPVRGGDRKQLARALHRAVSAHFVPSTSSS